MRSSIVAGVCALTNLLASGMKESQEMTIWFPDNRRGGLARIDGRRNEINTSK